MEKKNIELELLEIWKNILGIDNLELTESFFEAGGNSLLISKLQLKIKSNLLFDFSIADLFKYSSIQKQVCNVQK